MATITEDYCSQEVYRLLREKGFDGEIHTTFDKDGYTQASITLQMACKWLREIHNIFIEISVSIDLNGDYHHNYSILDKECKYVRKGYTSFDWNYVDACEAAIKYCLENLI